MEGGGLLILHSKKRSTDRKRLICCYYRFITSPVDSPQLYENFVEEVDAVDNGISQCDGEARYAVSTTLSARVSHLNPRWNSKSQDTEVK